MKSSMKIKRQVEELRLIKGESPIVCKYNWGTVIIVMQNCWDVYFCFLELGVLVITILQGKEMPAMDSNGEVYVEITRSSISSIKRTESTLFWGRYSLVNMSCNKCDGSERKQYKCGKGKGMKKIKMKWREQEWEWTTFFSLLSPSLTYHYGPRINETEPWTINETINKTCTITQRCCDPQ